MSLLYIPCDGSKPYEDDGWPGDHAIYGCGIMVPGANFDLLLRAARDGVLRGAAGIVVPPEAVTWPKDIRERVAHVLKLLLSVYVVDELSKEWMAHYGMEALVGGDPTWNIPADALVDAAVSTASKVDYAVVERPRGAVKFARRRTPMILRASGHENFQEKPLMRWADACGLADSVATSAASFTEKLALLESNPEAFTMSNAALKREEDRGREVIEVLLAAAPSADASDTEAIVEAAIGMGLGMGGASLNASLPPPPLPIGARRLKLGSKFNPATHYTEEYFEGGIQFCRPNGEWNLYRGPAKDWQGFAVAAAIIDKVVPWKPDAVALDMGASAGSFVRALRAHGRAIVGVDLSSAAADSKYVLQGDVTDPRVQSKLAKGRNQLVTALDFWEHIFLEDIPALLEATRDLLMPGGLHFAVICTKNERDSDFTAKLGEVVTSTNSWALVSGHVTIRRWVWWARLFRKHGFKIRHDVANLFQVRRDEGLLRDCRSWGPKNTLVLEKI